MTPGVPVSAATRIDLHAHTTASDGTLSPAMLVATASERGIAVLAVCDHDTTAGLAEAQAAGARLGVTVIPAVEFSTDVPTGEVHLLGYGIDPEEPDFLAATAAFRASREDRAAQMLERLRGLGIDVPQELLPDTPPGGSLGRPHIARALIAMGIVGSIDEAFARFIGHGGPAYVPRFRLLPEDAVRIVAGAGGLPVMAHPYSAGDYEQMLPSLIAAGLRGLEAYYGSYDGERRQRIAAVARHHGLLATVGSDYHGPDGRDGRELGSVTAPDGVWQRIAEALAETAWGRSGGFTSASQ